MGSTTKLKEKLAKREKVLITYIGAIAPPAFAEDYGKSGVDSAIVDMEHGAFCPENIGPFAQACNKVGFPLIARIQDCEYHCISKAVDQGCDGILVPRVERIEQMELAIASMRFHPVGRKGVGGPACLRGESVAEFNQNRLIFMQVESPKGVEVLDEILTKYGHEIAGVIIGPSDLSIMSGCPLQYDAEPVLQCIRKTIAICQAHEKSIGMFMNNMAEAKKWYGEGMNIFWNGSERECMYRGLKSLADAVADFDTVDNAESISIYG